MTRCERKYRAAVRKLEKTLADLLEFHRPYMELANVLVEVYFNASKETEEKNS